MNYQDRLKAYLMNTEGYLTYEWTEDSTPFSELAATAEDFIYRNSIEGKIAALFIYHQLCIEILKQLINYSNFYERLSVYPVKIEFKKFKTDASYSEILNEFKFKVEFKDKKKLLMQIKVINDLRNKFGHELFSKWWEHDMDIDLKELKNQFDKIFKTFGVCLNDLRANISKVRTKPELIALIEKDDSN
ncbi:MAG: hypothetical protein K9J13_03065 [Saprospiraceae bacterium]|nr:hypothetical protein [Saprospiraceae bacterium]